MTVHTEEDQNAILAAGAIADMLKIMIVENWPRILEEADGNEVPAAKVGFALTVATSGVNRQHILKMNIPRKSYKDERATVADSELPQLSTDEEFEREDVEEGLP